MDKFYRSIEEFILEKESMDSFSKKLLEDNMLPIQESNVTGKFDSAADVFVKYLNKKTGKAFKKFPFYDYYEKEGNVTGYGCRYYSEKDMTSIRINNERGGSPGLIASVDYWDRSSKIPDLGFYSDSIPIVKLIKEIERVISDKSYSRSVMESCEEYHKNMLNEGRKPKPPLSQEQVDEVTRRLAAGETGKKISEDMGITYPRVLDIKKGTYEIPKTTPEEKRNNNTLEDKLAWFNETMEDIEEVTRSIAAGAPGMNSLLITGRAGTGKTFNVEKALEKEGLVQDEDYFKLQGSISKIEMYRKFYQFKDGKVIVFDDADSVFGDPESRNILKAALDSKPVRRVSYAKMLGTLYDPKQYEDDPEGEVKELDNGKIPQYFEFSSRVIFISNLSKEKADPDGAIRSRSILINVDPDDETLMARIRKLLPIFEPKEMPLEEKEEIFDFIANAGDVSMRTFVKAAGFKLAGLSNWKRMVQRYL